MTEEIICTSCNQNEAVEKCAVCDVDLCDMCKHVIHTEDISASHRVQGVSTEGVLGSAQKKVTVCEKCMTETDFFEEEHEGVIIHEEAPEKGAKDRLKAFKMPKKGEIMEQLGEFNIDLTDITPDIRGKEELVRKILRTDFNETRFRQYDTKIRPFLRAEELFNDWDRTLLERYRPLFTNPETKNGRGKPKMAPPADQARKALKEALSGATKSVASAREVLEAALKAVGPEAPIDLGMSIAYPACNTAVLAGFYPETLKEIDEALSYAEKQLAENAAVLEQGTGEPLELEGRVLHMGSVEVLATECEELVKICCFDYISTGDLPAPEMPSYPDVRTPVGLGTVDRDKPVLAFFGDNFLPIFHTVGRLEEEGLDKGIEITGLGNAGHELVRFYRDGKILTSTGKAIKGIRLGIADLIVASDSCFPLDVVAQAKKAGIPVLVTGPRGSYAASDRSQETVKKITGRLKKRQSVLVHSIEKAAEVVTGFFKDFPGKMGRVPGETATQPAMEKCTECEKCFHACPNSLQISLALKGKDGASPSDLYDTCIFCGQCEAVCPEKIPIIDCILAASGDKISEDQFRMRPGRGPISHLGFRDLTFGLVLGGNAPGFVALLGCGHYPGSDKELNEMAKELLDRNCMVMTAGCGAADVARQIDPETGKAFPENYLSLATLKGMVNCGGCSAISHILASTYKGPLLGGGISVKANFDQPSDYIFNRTPLAIIMWGTASDKMMTKALGFARAGTPVIIGPSGFKFSQMLVGNKYDRDSWTMYDGLTGETKEVDPSPPHLIYPVETKEEAITMAVKLCFVPCALRDPRTSTIDNYTEIYQQYFDEFPDDWPLYVRSPLELHVMKRMKLLKMLRDEFGWEVDRTQVTKVKNRAGKLVGLEEYVDNYGLKQGAYATMVKRLVMREAVKE
ncbi:4Fe-4S dicluster domain-containing protein [Thermodesulfobacteriota bacterium]